MDKLLFISVKPEFVDKIFNGTKQIELRKSRPHIDKGSVVLIYSTLPVKALIGACVVESVIKDTPLKLWKEYSQLLGIDRKRYFEYYEGSELAVGIRLTSIQKFNHEIPLASIKNHFPEFTPPQTFKYFIKSRFEKAYPEYRQALSIA